MGKVRLIEPAAFTKISALGVKEQRVNVICDFALPHQQVAGLEDGFRMEARIVVDQVEQALKVPNSPLFCVPGDWFAFRRSSIQGGA